MAGCLYAGTSGFSYPAWRGAFYPRDASPDSFLRLYAERLPSVELNVTSYRMPSAEQVAAWVAETPEAFRFAVRMSRRVTDGGQLGLVPAFCRRIEDLRERLGVLYVSLPEERERDDAFLASLLERIAPGIPSAIDLRHASWVGAEVDAILESASAARVGARSGPLWYLRMREPPYSARVLSDLAAAIEPALREGTDVYCFFKHEDDPRGALYAERLVKLVRSAL